MSYQVQRQLSISFIFQVPRGVKNAMNLDKRNKNNLWQEAITDYETFIILDSGEDVPKGYQSCQI
jgi:hypothetical protein